MRAVLLDLFGGRVGGGGAGYRRAGFTVVSVDIEDCPDSPADVTIKGDVFAELPWILNVFRPVAVHASPPCQGRGALANGTMPSLRDRHPDLIPATRAALRATGLPYVIENVQQSGVRPDVVLCGEMFGLGVIQHRNFELGRWSIQQGPTHVRHRGRVRGWRHGVWSDGPYVAAYGNGGGKATVDEMRRAKRIDWSRDRQGLCDALPPDYTRWIGDRLLSHLSGHG